VLVQKSSPVIHLRIGDPLKHCAEYEKLWKEYLDANRAYQQALFGPSTATDKATGFSVAILLKNSAMERALIHKEKCLLCTYLKAELS
jgi:hypothetical protein